MARRKTLGAVVRYSLDLPVDLYNDLRHIALQKKMDLSALVRLALRDYVKSYEEEVTEAHTPQPSKETEGEEKMPEEPQEYERVEVEMLKDMPPFTKGSRLVIGPETALKWEEMGVARRVG